MSTNPRLEEIARRQMQDNLREDSLKQRMAVVNDEILLSEEYEFLRELVSQTNEAIEDVVSGWAGAKGMKIENGRITEIRFTMAGGVKYIPEGIKYLTSLNCLLLMCGEISDIPKNLPKEIRTLWLSSNNIQTVPEEIGELTGLELMNLCGNQLASLPKSARNLKNIWCLELYDNRFEEIPEEIAGMKKLKHLYIQENQIKSLRPSICRLQDLIVLDISNNPIAELPGDIVNLVSLEALHLEGTYLEYLPGELAQMPRLEKIYVNRGVRFPRKLADKVKY